jgi:hypothetical protein
VERKVEKLNFGKIIDRYKQQVIFAVFYTVSVIGLFPENAELWYTVQEITRPTFAVNFYQDELYPGTKIRASFSHQRIIKDRFVVGYYIDEETAGEVQSDALYIEGSDNFSPSIAYDKKRRVSLLPAWIPTFYLPSLDMDDPRDILRHEPHIERIGKKRSNFIYTKYNIFTPTKFWFNNIAIYIESSLIYSGLSAFFITRLSNYDDIFYKAEVTPLILDIDYIKDGKLEDFERGRQYVLYIHHNRNRLRIYVEGEEEPRWELMNVGREFAAHFDKFPHAGKWPADKDYKSYLAPDIFEPWPSLTLSEIKTMLEDMRPPPQIIPFSLHEGRAYRTTANLRLRSTPDTKGVIRMTIPAGTVVKLLSRGETETIDGITAPWIEVILEGGKHGWCFSGYLEEVKEEAPAPAPPPAALPAAGEAEKTGEKSGGIPAAVLAGGGVFIAVGGLCAAFVMRKKKT